MDVRRLFDAPEFLDEAMPLLLADEARHNLMLGIAGTVRDQPARYDEFRAWLVEHRGAVVAAALQTPPFNFVLARPADDDAIGALADAVAGDGIDLPGVVGAIPEVDAFAEAWEARHRTTRVLRTSQRIYRLTELRPPTDVAGNARVATAEDLPLLIDWIEAFVREALHEAPGGPASDTERVVRSRLSAPEGGFMLWEDDGPGSLAGWGGPTPNGIRIGPVYTPPDRRSRGYGSAVTAAVSEQQLAKGKQFCFLYTDLANATSNSIYKRIGYEPVCDSIDYGFEPRSPS